MAKVANDKEVDEKEAIEIPLNSAQNGDKADKTIPMIEIKQNPTSPSIRLPPIDHGYAWIIFLGTF